MIPPQVGDFRVWHNPQIPGPSFFARCDDFYFAQHLTAILGDYDLFLEKNGLEIRCDYSNANGIQVFTNDGWHDVESMEDVELALEEML